MTLTVEDGTGLLDVDALISLEDWKAYAGAHGMDYQDPPGRENSAFDDALELEPAIRRASAYVSDSFSWPGQRLNGRAQAFAWPRSGAVDQEGLTVTGLPIEVVRAVAEAAWYELTIGPLNPAVTASDRVKREKIGPMETEYAVGDDAVADATPVLTKLNALLRPLLMADTPAVFVV